jgi:hypothetical protein
MTPDPRAVALLAVAFGSLGWAMYRFRRFAAVFATVMTLLFPILSITSDWNNWFDWAKRCSILLGVVMLAIPQAYPRNRFALWFVRLWPFVLILNVLEGAALEFPNLSPLNGILLIAVGLYVPFQLTWDERYQRYGFRGPFWQAAFLSTLARLYVLNPEFENAVVGAVLVLVLASVFCLWQRDSFNYPSWRAYIIYGVLLQDSLFPKLSDQFYPAWLNAENRTLWHGTPFANAWPAVNVVLVGLMIYERHRVHRQADRPEAVQAAAGESLQIAAGA